MNFFFFPYFLKKELNGFWIFWYDSIFFHYNNIYNDIFHRVIVAGGGGGADNPAGYLEGRDDGSGGAGGGLTAQGFVINGVPNTKYVATQTNGFTFGSGESAQQYGSKNSKMG